MIFATLFLGLFIAIGIALIGWGVLSAFRSMAVGAWPTAPGKIEECTLHESSDSDGSTYKVNVSYTYRVGGKTYAGSRIAYGYGGSSESGMHRELYDRLHDSHGIEVRYNPTDPTTSALSHGLHHSIVFIIVFGIIWSTFSVGLAFLIWLGKSGGDVLVKNLLIR